MPDIGAVPVSGSRKVSPRTTTTYRITVRSADGRTQTASVTVRVVISEQAALTALYETTGGPNWTSRGNWGTGRPLGEWHGVSVDEPRARDQVGPDQQWSVGSDFRPSWTP